MNIEFREFCKSIECNDNIPSQNKEDLLKYIKVNLFSKVRVFSAEDYSVLNNILNDISFDFYYFEKLLDTVYTIRNSINSKKNSGKTVPKADYVFAIYNLFKSIYMDLWEYDSSFVLQNIALSRGGYKIVFENGMLNNEVSLIDFCKTIYDRYCSTYNPNKTVPIIIKNVLRIEKSFMELEEKYNYVFTSEELMSLFECFNEINGINFNDLIKEYYPSLRNELFVLIKKSIINSSEENVSTEYVVSYINNAISRRKTFEKKREKIISKIERIDVEVEKNVEKTFTTYIEYIQSNKNIDDDIKELIVKNIKNMFEKYRDIQTSFVNSELDKFFDNCSAFVNDLIVPNGSDNGVDQLIAVMLTNCKDFFVEYDSKKFKEIVDYVLENTDISIEQLKDVGENCLEFFKDADVEKLKTINVCLKEFKSFICKNYKDSDFVDDIFEHVLINNPEMLLKNNKLYEVISFLKGETSLGEYGYRCKEFSLKKDFLSFSFFRKMKEENYKILFEGSMGLLINNLNYLEEKCNLCNIDFSNFNFNENMIYVLLSDDLYSVGTNLWRIIKDMFDEKDFKKLVELNPNLLMIADRHLEIIITRCLLNLNEDYNFYDLLSSELFFYDINEYNDNSYESLIDKPFKYINLNFNTSREYDIEELLTSDFFNTGESQLIYKKYIERKELRNELDALIRNFDVFSNNSLDLHQLVIDTLEKYNEIYSKVPNLNVKNIILDLINSKKERYEYEISDIIEELEDKKNRIASQRIDSDDSELVIDKVKELMDTVESENVKVELENFWLRFQKDFKEKNIDKYNELLEEVKAIEEKMRDLENQVEELNYLFNMVENNNIGMEDNLCVLPKTFSIKDLVNLNIDSSKQNEDMLDSVLNERNLIIFADQVDLSEIPNDRNFIDKVYKFLGSGEFSISSPKFMKANALNREFVEKFSDHRSEIFSRRESRTPVRVYFLPVKNKYFDCYYVVGVNYKDHNHLDGGCSNDEVYNRRLREVKELEETIARLGESDMNRLIKWVETYKEIYDNQMEPIISKVEVIEKKRNNKK